MPAPASEFGDNPYRSPSSNGGKIPFPGKLIESGWLRRKVEMGPPFNVTIEYNGRGFGYESVLVNDVLVARKTSWRWFVPRFDFVVSTSNGDRTATVEVRVRPWLTLGRITIRIDGALVYAEGATIV